MNEDLKEMWALKMTCSYCGATPDYKCRNVDGTICKPHKARTGVLLDAFAAGYERALDERIDVA